MTTLGGPLLGGSIGGQDSRDETCRIDEFMRSGSVCTVEEEKIFHQVQDGEFNVIAEQEGVHQNATLEETKETDLKYWSETDTGPNSTISASDMTTTIPALK